MLHIPEQAYQHRYDLKFTAHPVAHLVKEVRILVSQSLLRIIAEGITMPSSKFAAEYFVNFNPTSAGKRQDADPSQVLQVALSHSLIRDFTAICSNR
jgi:hypothetical protein